jgi:FkbM family methyltransferase
MIFSRISFSLSQRKFWKTVRRKREEWKTIAAKQKEVIIPISGNYKIKLQTSSELSSHIFCGAFEWEEREWLFSELKASDVFYDIGANIGLFTLLASERCKHVIAFEPINDTFRMLSENVALNSTPKNIQLINAAASDNEGSQDIYVLTNGKDAWNSMAVKPEEGQYRVDQIRTVNIDTLVQAKQILPPRVIKIDVEGWELHVLHGLVKTIENHRPVMLIEFTRQNLEAAGTSPDELGSFIYSLGYNLFGYSPRSKELEPVTRFDFRHKNLIAKPRT